MQPDIYVQRKTGKELHRWDSLNLSLQNKYCRWYCIDSKLSLIKNIHLDKKQRIFSWVLKKEVCKLCTLRHRILHNLQDTSKNNVVKSWWYLLNESYIINQDE